MSISFKAALERAAGIEPASSAWKAEVLPLNYTRGNRLPTPGPTPANGGSKTPTGIILGGGGWIRTTEARASDLQSDPFGHSGTPPEGRTFSRSGPLVSTGLEGEFFASGGTRKLGLPLRLRQLPNSFLS